MELLDEQINYLKNKNLNDDQKTILEHLENIQFFIEEIQESSSISEIKWYLKELESALDKLENLSCLEKIEPQIDESICELEELTEEEENWNYFIENIKDLIREMR